MTLSTKGVLYQCAYPTEILAKPPRHCQHCTLPTAHPVLLPDALSNRAQDNRSAPQKFSLFRVTKETFKGVFRPIGTMIHHPFKTAFTLGATLTLATVAPITIPIMVWAGLGFGAVQTAKGIKTAIGEAQQGNYLAAEKAFGDIGEGASSIISSLLGVRQAGAITAEAKASRLALNTTASAKDKLSAIDEGLKAVIRIQQGSYTNALKETVSIFSIEGIQAAGTQLNPVRISALAKAKIQTIKALFTESPVVNLNESMSKGQHFLGIKNSDMPKLVPNVTKEVPISANARKGANVHGFYNIQNHTIHVESDRLKALSDIIPPIKNFPKSMQYFLANLYKRQYNVDEIVVHELAHAQQFKQITQLEKNEALQLIQRKMPDLPKSMVELITQSIPFQNTATKTLSFKQQQIAEQQLLKHVEARFNRLTQIQLKIKARQQGNTLNALKHLQKEQSAYYRDGLEIAARQKAAESGIVETLQTLQQAPGIAKQNEALLRYKALKTEAKLNKLMAQINLAKQQSDLHTKRLYKNHLQHWLTVSPKQTITLQYLKQEQQMKHSVRILQNFQPNASVNKPQPTPWYRKLTQLPGRVLGWVRHIFFPKQAVPQGSVKPAYIAINHHINRHNNQSKVVFSSDSF